MEAGEKPHQPLLKGKEGSEWHCAFTSLSMHELAKREDIGALAHDAPSLFKCVLSSLYDAHARACRRYFYAHI